MNEGVPSCKTTNNPHSAVVVVAGGGHSAAASMMPRGLPTRRGLQVLVLIIATAYATILLYQAIAPRQVTGTIVSALPIAASSPRSPPPPPRDSTAIPMTTSVHPRTFVESHSPGGRCPSA